MNVTIKTLDDGSVELNLILTAEEAARQKEPKAEGDVHIMGTYCVTCPDGISHEISANGDIDAFFKGVATCGGSFGMHIGRCLP